MQIGIVGTGRMATARTQSVAKIDGLEVGWICSRSVEGANAFIEQQDDGLIPESTRAFGEFANALGDSEVSAVILTGPNSTHYEDVRLAFEAGKNVFVEYPPAITAKQGASLMDLARSYRISYHVGLTYLYGGKHKKIAELCMGNEELGKPISYQHIFCSGNPISRWYNIDELSGGMFIGSLYHYIDEALDYFGDYEAYFASYHCKKNDQGIILSDSGSIQIAFATGCTAQLCYARGMAKPGIGNKRTIIFENGYISEIGDAAIVIHPDRSEKLDEGDRDAVLDDTAAFIDEIRAGIILDGTAEHAQRALVLAEGAQAMVNEGV